MMRKIISSAAALTLLAFSQGSFASVITIADFESDALGSTPGAPVVMTQGDVTVRSNSDFSDAVAPSLFGDRFAYLTTRGGTSVGSSGNDFTGDGNNEYDITFMDVAFTAPQPGTLTFFWNIITAEVIGGEADPVEILLDGTPVFQGAIYFDNGSFPAITNWFTCDGGPGTSNSCSDPYGEEYGHITPMSYSGPVAAGSHMLRFLVADDLDGIAATGLVVDNITLDVQSVPEGTPLVLMGLGLLGLGLRRKMKSPH